MVFESLQADTNEERRRAWEFGLSSDGQQEWGRRAQELGAYRARYGDSHIGFREGDAPELTRWAAKQRCEWRAGELRQDRQCSCHRSPITLRGRIEAEPVLILMGSAGPLRSSWIASCNLASWKTLDEWQLQASMELQHEANPAPAYAWRLEHSGSRLHCG